MGERVAAGVDVGERERAELVDHHGLVREPVRERDRAGRRAAAPAHQRLHELEQPVGPHRAHDARVDQDLHAAELVRHAARDAHSFAHLVWSSLDLCLEILKGLLEVGRHHRFRDLLGDRAEHPSGGVVGEPQRHARARVVGLAQAPAQALVDAGDAGPGQVGGLVELDDLDQAAHVGRPHVQVDRVARADALLGPVVLALEPGHAVHEARVEAGVRDQLPDLLARGVDDGCLLDPHPITGRRRSSCSAVSARCMRSMISS